MKTFTILLKKKKSKECAARTHRTRKQTVTIATNAIKNEE